MQTVHGAALAGAVLLMLAVVLSGSLSWTPYAMDFGRRHPEGTSSWKIFGFAAGGTLAAGLSAALLGLSAASVIGGNQTAAGIRTEVGGGAAGDVALAAIMLAAVLSCCMNAYSSSLAFQAAGVAVRRPWLTIAISGAALGLVIWMQTGSVSGHFQEVLLLADYWVAAFVPIVAIDWLAGAPGTPRSACSMRCRCAGARRLARAGRVRGRLHGHGPVHGHHRVRGSRGRRAEGRGSGLPGRIRGDRPAVLGATAATSAFDSFPDARGVSHPVKGR